MVQTLVGMPPSCVVVHGFVSQLCLQVQLHANAHTERLQMMAPDTWEAWIEFQPPDFGLAYPQLLAVIWGVSSKWKTSVCSCLSAIQVSLNK